MVYSLQGEHLESNIMDSADLQTFHAGAVCAFIAIREPSTERGRKCLVRLVQLRAAGS